MRGRNAARARQYRAWAPAAGVAIVAMLSLAEGAAQHDHAAGGPPPAETVTACAQAQLLVAHTLDSASARLEAARQTNSPTALRAAIEDLQRDLGDLRAQLAPCAKMQSAGAGVAPVGRAAPGPPAPTAGDSDAKPVQIPAAPIEATDPACGPPVDPETATSATGEGRTYHFGSAAGRERFPKDPAGLSGR